MATGFPGDIRSLTSARFFAAMAVVMQHFEQELPGKSLLAGVMVFEHGYLAVDFFFILSGFILSHVYAAKVCTGQYSHRQFLVTRLARIYPLHFATTMFYVVVGLGALAAGISVGRPDRYDLSFLPSHLLLIQAWGSVDSGTFNYPSWSVSCEWFAYLLFPLFVLAATATLRHVGPLVALVSAALTIGVVNAFLTWTMGLPIVDLHNNFGFMRIAPEFLYGVALWNFGRTRQSVLLGTWWMPLLLLLAAIGLAYGRISLVGAIILLGLLILSLAERERRGGGLMSRGPAVFGGRISYAIYMIHLPVLTIGSNVLQRVLHMPASALSILVGIPLVLLVATLAHRYIEVPSAARVKTLLLGMSLEGVPSAAPGSATRHQRAAR